MKKKKAKKPTPVRIGKYTLVKKLGEELDEKNEVFKHLTTLKASIENELAVLFGSMTQLYDLIMKLELNEFRG